MTILDTTNNILLFFIRNSCFIFNRDVKEIFKDSKNPLEEEALIMSALNDLHIAKVIELYRVENEQKTLKDSVWVLRRSLDTYQQTVSINSMTAIQISQIINNFCELAGENNVSCNPQQIIDKDLNNLLQICSIIIDRIRILEEKEIKRENKKK